MRFRNYEIKSNSELVYPARDFCAGAEARTFCNLNVALKGHSSTDRDTATLDLPLVYTREQSTAEWLQAETLVGSAARKAIATRAELNLND